MAAAPNAIHEDRRTAVRERVLTICKRFGCTPRQTEKAVDDALAALTAEPSSAHRAIQAGQETASRLTAPEFIAAAHERMIDHDLVRDAFRLEILSGVLTVVVGAIGFLVQS